MPVNVVTLARRSQAKAGSFREAPLDGEPGAVATAAVDAAVTRRISRDDYSDAAAAPAVAGESISAPIPLSTSAASSLLHDESVSWPAGRKQLLTAPGAGALCYAALSCHTALAGLPTWTQSPLLYCASRSLLAGACVGLGAYAHGRQHMKNVSLAEGLVYSAFGSVLFNLGSLTIMTAIQRSPALTTSGRLVLGLGAALALLTAAKRYLALVDFW